MINTLESVLTTDETRRQMGRYLNGYLTPINIIIVGMSNNTPNLINDVFFVNLDTNYDIHKVAIIRRLHILVL